MIGSHDNAIDVLANELKRRDSRLHLSSSNVGSMGGLMAIRRAQTHLAGSHLLDTETGDYNFSYIERYLRGTPLRLVQLARRSQGLLVSAGNPKSIRSVADLHRPDVVFINRQGGSGTRVLLDYELGKLGLPASAIHGYDYEEFTHLAVAAAVASGLADGGLGIAAAAQALDLDFVPLFVERYDLIIPEEHYTSPRLRPLLDLLHEARFRREVEALPGYTVKDMGKRVA
jgi:putative molybdopterin biosynthesis protein